MSGSSSRQSQMVADEMFPDGPGPLDFVDVEDGVRGLIMCFLLLRNSKFVLLLGAGRCCWRSCGTSL